MAIRKIKLPRGQDHKPRKYLQQIHKELYANQHMWKVKVEPGDVQLKLQLCLYHGFDPADWNQDPFPATFYTHHTRRVTDLED